MIPSKFKSVAPVLRLNNRTMQPTMDLFIDRLGFSEDTVLGTPPRFAMVKRDNLIVMLECKKMLPWKQSGWAIYFWVDDARKYREEIIKSGFMGVSEVIEKDYGCIEFKVPLPDKRSLVFGQVLSPN